MLTPKYIPADPPLGTVINVSISEFVSAVGLPAFVVAHTVFVTKNVLDVELSQLPPSTSMFALTFPAALSSTTRFVAAYEVVGVSVPKFIAVFDTCAKHVADTLTLACTEFEEAALSRIPVSGDSKTAAISPEASNSIATIEEFIEGFFT